MKAKVARATCRNLNAILLSQRMDSPMNTSSTNQSASNDALSTDSDGFQRDFVTNLSNSAGFLFLPCGATWRTGDSQRSSQVAIEAKC